LGPVKSLPEVLDIFNSSKDSGHHDIAEILLKVALNTKIQIQKIQ